MDILGIEIGERQWPVTLLTVGPLGMKIRECLQITGDTDRAKIDAILDVISRNAFKDASIAICLPVGSYISRILTVPAPNPEALEGIVRFEIEKHIPYSIDEVRFCPRVIEKINNVFKVLVTVVKKVDFDNIVALFKNHGLKIVCMETRQVALFNALDYRGSLPESGNFSIVHVRKETAVVYTFSGYMPVDTRRIKIEYGAPDKWTGTLERELRSTSLTLNAHTGNGKLDEVLLLCEFPVGDELHTKLETGMRLTVRDICLPDNVIPPRNVISSGAALTASGRGRLSTGLLPVSGINKLRIFSTYATHLLLAATVFLLISGGSSYLVNDILTLRRLDRAVSGLKTRTAELHKATDELEVLNRRIHLLEKADASGTLDPLDILRELTVLLPDDTWLMNFEYKDGIIYLEGFSNRASALLPKMEQSSFLRDVEFIGRITKKREGKERFKMKALVQNVTDRG